MAITRVDIFVATARAISALNAGTASAFDGTVADERRATGEIEAAILAADARVCRARASRYGDGYRSLFLALSASIPHGSVIPDHLGPIEQVVIKHASADSAYKAGKTDPFLTLADIENWRAQGAALYGAAHDASGSAVAGYYREVGGQLFYTGSDAKAYLANFTRTSSCQAPEVDEDMVVGLALESLLKEGDSGGALVQNMIAAARAQLSALEAPAALREAA